MKRQTVYSISFLLFLLTFFPSISHSQERDYAYTGAYLDDRDPDEENEYGELHLLLRQQ